MKNKKIIISVIIIILLLIGGGIFLMSELRVKQSPTPVQQTGQPATNTTTTNTGPKLEQVEGTMKSLLSGGKTQKCTFSYNTDNSTITGQVYVANGKIREEFQSTSTTGPINGHMIVYNQEAFMWTDQMNRGFKFSIGEQPTPAVKNDKTPDINKEMSFDCLPWSEDASMFTVPANITFQSMAAPVAPITGTAGQTGTGSSNLSNQCAVCNNVPEGPGREACKTQLKCQ